MTHRQQALLSWAAAAAVLLAGCRGGSRPGSMSGSSGSTGSAVTTQTSGWQTGLGVLTETSDEGRTGTIHTIAAAVLLDGEGKVADVMLDELEVELSADGKGAVTMPTDYRTKRQKGDDYPLAAASSLKKGWAEQADAFADYLTGLTPQQAARLETDKDGRAADPDLLSGCTIRVDKYRDAVAKACASAAPLGGAKGDRVSLGVAAENASSDVTATDDKDLNAEVELTFAALTLDADGRITSAIGDMAEPALTVAADGRPHQAGAGRRLRDAGRLRPRQRVVRAQRGLLQLPQGQDRGRGGVHPRRRLRPRPRGPLHHLHRRLAEGRGGCV